jgi:hypothetical protein
MTRNCESFFCLKISEEIFFDLEVEKSSSKHLVEGEGRVESTHGLAEPAAQE